MIVLKFGGTSVSTKERLETICEIVRTSQFEQPILVVSALNTVTNLLLSCIDTKPQKRNSILKNIETIHTKLIDSTFTEDEARKLRKYVKGTLQEVESILHDNTRNQRVTDRVLSYGEKLSSYIISECLTLHGIRSKQVVTTEIIVTDDNFGAADVIPKETKKRVKETITPLVSDGFVPILTGFIGATREGTVTTLGRGGSDYTASIVGYCINATEIQIWTDVDGIFTADPRHIETASKLPIVSYREASELAAFGAKVLHPRTIRPAMKAGIPVRVLNTDKPGGSGTVIISTESKRSRVSAVASKQEVYLVNLYSTEMLFSKGFLERIFTVFATYNISVDLVSVSEVSVSVTLDNDDNLDAACEELSLFTTVSLRKVGLVSLIGEGVAEVSHIMRDVFSLLDSRNIPVYMVSLGASKINISIVTDTKHVPYSVRLLHDTFFSNKQMYVRSFV